MKQRQLTLLFFTIALGGCAVHAHVDVGNDKKDRESIAEARDAYADAMSRGDLDAVMNTLTDDVVVMYAGGPAIEGKTDVRRWTERVFAQYHPNVKYEVDELEVVDDWAIERGVYDRGTASMRYGKRLWVYRRDEDGWRIRYIMWNDDGAG